MPTKEELAQAAAILGSARSKAKTTAARKNAKKPRKRKLPIFPAQIIKRRFLRSE